MTALNADAHGVAEEAALASDALVFFGATGDLAFKKIFPALQAMVIRSNLNIPIIGVGRSNWSLEQLVNRARESVTKFYPSATDEDFAKLAKLLRYVDADYKKADTFDQLRKELGDAQRPIHYLAIPPSVFPVVSQYSAFHGS